MATINELENASNDPRLQEFVGKMGIISLYQFYKREPYERSQDYGEIIGFERKMLILQTQTGKKYFPVNYEAFVFAPRGKYILDSTGDEIIDPEFLVSWRVDLADNLIDSKWTANTAPHFASIVGKEWVFEYSDKYDKDYLEELIKTKGNELIGNKVLAGLREYKILDNGTRKLAKQSQIYGEVVRISFSEGVVIKLKDDTEYSLPPDISMLQVPPPGEYVLQSTQEVILNPDLITMWTIN